MINIILIACTQRQGEYWAHDLKLKRGEYKIISSIEKLRGYRKCKYKYVGEYWKIGIDKLDEIEEHVSSPANEMEEI